MHRTQGFLGQCVALGHEPGNTEVRHLHRTILQHHNVMGLDIPMDNTTAVGVFQRLADLDAKMKGLFPVQHTFFLHVLLQGNALDQFHHNIVRDFRSGNIVNRHNIGMAKHRNRLALRMEAAAELFIRRVVIF